MRYDIKLTIDYIYESPAAGARQILHVMPLAIEGRQRVIAGSIHIEPKPAMRQDRRDFFGNDLTELAFTEPHSDITIVLKARVDVTGSAAPGSPSPDLPELARALDAQTDLGPRSPLHFLAASPYAEPVREIAVWARRHSPPGRPVADIVAGLGLTLHREMRFDAEATTVSTPAAEAFASRHGVCQDFTHIMIIALRSLGIPAGYVSGYLRTLPPPGKERLEGADAMHAWVSVWCGPETGWVEYDPTNAVFAGDGHIVVAHGRDYADVAPVRGAMRISGGQTTDQFVDVVPVNETVA
ncbi:MAG: transglutaminase family protein [Hoeflea sp.]|uniref:transglutaminase family protein n=1 Tax=Hoeflea sp. TaxID=1940281 RepID=UPI001D8F1AA9|nr:transglutaminase family protein [Hoeflea sp.]MBU4529071.1 transglutaminase family protein [Alphaproteobacteria bacterium]MBU4543476.1 transglutaminase family protein [Alphaproteobacteria bacterium]MBU4549101.1 transglutaminase family protein [Alphaproteobacteria bacterium]MBV1725236.1 transglutaminase family protein [Hoeflea sp.]MBV1785197.1 transglutaminase family protein [Hoeflea sp.]